MRNLSTEHALLLAAVFVIVSAVVLAQCGGGG